jgi:IS30 family transposase
MEREWSGNVRRLSQADRAKIERLVRGGETFATTAEAVGCSEKSIQRYLRATGGLRSRLKERSARYLSAANREELSRGLMAGDTMRGIAERLKRAPSTISREVALNGGRDEYRAWKADIAALERGRRPKPAKLLLHAKLRCEVDRRLCELWSPQQIAAQLVREYPDDPSMRVSHETIYKTLFVQARGALRKELTRYLRTGRTQRRPRLRTEYNGGGRLQNMVMISERPATWRSISAIPTVPGNAGATKTPTDSFGSTFRASRTCPCTAQRTFERGRQTAERPAERDVRMDETS